MSHQHAYADDEAGIFSPIAAGSCVEIDEHHCLARWNYQPDRRLAFNHDQPGQDYRCAGSVMLDPPSAGGWTYTGSLEGGDLPLSPSVLCSTHGDHGFVRDGKWVAA